MKFEELRTKEDIEISGPLVITPTVYSDERGIFFESWNMKKFNEYISCKVEFVQDNHSESNIGVLRGLHYQLDPFAQGKLVRCIKGRIFDVAVDLRKNSKTFLKWVGIEINQQNKKQLWIPTGFAHGFLTLSEKAEVLYKATGLWNRESERTIKWNDKQIDINWPLEVLKNKAPVLSEKDSKAPTSYELINREEVFS